MHGAVPSPDPVYDNYSNRPVHLSLAMASLIKSINTKAHIMSVRISDMLLIDRPQYCLEKQD